MQIWVGTTFELPQQCCVSLPTRANIVRWSRDSRYLFLLGVCVYLVDSESESILRTLCGKTVTGGTFKSGIWKNLSPVTVYPLWIASSSQRLEFMRLPTHDYTLDKCTTTFCIHNFPRRLSPPFMAIFLRGILYFGQENPQNLVYRNSSTGVLPGKIIYPVTSSKYQLWSTRIYWKKPSTRHVMAGHACTVARWQLRSCIRSSSVHAYPCNVQHVLNNREHSILWNSEISLAFYTAPFSERVLSSVLPTPARPWNVVIILMRH